MQNNRLLTTFNNNENCFVPKCKRIDLLRALHQQQQHRVELKDNRDIRYKSNEWDANAQNVFVLSRALAPKQ